MKICLLLLLCIQPLFATSLILVDSNLENEKYQELYELILKGDAPRRFFEPDSFDLQSELKKISAGSQLVWISPTVWQLGMLHGFFHDPAIREGVLACVKYGYSQLSYDEIVQERLPSLSKPAEIAYLFDSITLPHLCSLFFRINEHILSLHDLSEGEENRMISHILSDIPPLDEWKEREFPFWEYQWITNPRSIQLFYQGLTDEKMVKRCAELEKEAHESGKWVFYRGYPGCGFPTTLQPNRKDSHALSFGSTLLGGAFFALESSALTYSKTEKRWAYCFLALSLTPDEIDTFFRIGPLHPFLQMIADGEMFHAHTKIASQNLGEQPLDGYFMKCNKTCTESAGYILNQNMSVSEFEEGFQAVIKKAYFLPNNPSSMHFGN